MTSICLTSPVLFEPRFAGEVEQRHSSPRRRNRAILRLAGAGFAFWHSQKERGWRLLALPVVYSTTSSSSGLRLSGLPPTYCELRWRFDAGTTPASISVWCVPVSADCRSFGGGPPGERRSRYGRRNTRLISQELGLRKERCSGTRGQRTAASLGIDCCEQVNLRRGCLGGHPLQRLLFLTLPVPMQEP